MTAYVALLRGINVGGKNPVPMPALKACFEEQGFEDVATYIQSGNVLFDAPRTSAAALIARVERALADAFPRYDARVALRTRAQLRAIVDRAPKGFGSLPAEFRYDVVFLMGPVSAASALRQLSLKPEVDRAWAGSGVLYLSRLTARATQSRLNRIASLPIYQRMTIRNWNTTTKLVALMDARAASP